MLIMLVPVKSKLHGMLNRYYSTNKCEPRTKWTQLCTSSHYKMSLSNLQFLDVDCQIVYWL